MQITSPIFKQNDFIPLKYTCDGENISPPLMISDVPENTASLALIVDDPDAPSKTWVHWVLFNINPMVEEIIEATIPTGALTGLTDFGNTDYGGPCPPSGTHRYFFKLYALDIKLDLPAGATKPEVERAMSGHILDSAELIGLYSRTQG